jgi:hypothetical protein
MNYIQIELLFPYRRVGHTSKLTERETGRFVAVVDYSQLFYEHSLYNNVEKIGIKS